MKSKRIFAIIFLIVCILSISSVQAADLDNQTALSSDNAGDNIKSANEPGDFTELDSLIASASDSETITLEKDYKPTASEVSSSYRSGITVGKSLTIDGNGHTIFGDSNRIFFVSGGTLTLKNINFVGGDASMVSDWYYGTGAVAYISSGSVVVDNATFKDIGSSFSSGSSIFYGSSVTISNSLFKNCTGSNGLLGASQNNMGSVTVQNSTFLENTAAYIYKLDTFTIVYSYNSAYLFNLGTIFEGYGYSLYFNYNVVLTNSSKILRFDSYAEIEAVNFNYNYWGTNDNDKVNSLFDYNGANIYSGKTSNFDNVYLALEGTESFSEDDYGQYYVYFYGNNADQLPDLEASVSMDPVLGTFSPSTVVISSTPSTVRLTPTTYGNSTISVSKDGLELASYNISVNRSLLSDYSLAVNTSDIKYGEDLTVDVSLTDADSKGVTGIVTITVSNSRYEVNVIDGKGTIDIANTLIPDTYVINATYISTNPNYRNSTNSTSVTVSKLDADLSIAIEPSSVKEDESVNISVTLVDENSNPIANQNVAITDGDLTIATVITNASGHAYYIYTPNIDSSTITASYTGSAVYNPANPESAEVSVEPKTGTEIVLSSNLTGFIYPDESLTFTVALTDQNGNPLVGENVSIIINSADITQLTTDESGQATFVYTFITAGSVSVSAEFGGNENYRSASSNIIAVPVLSGNSFSDLALLIESSPENSVILLTNDFAFDSNIDYKYVYGIDINKNITIDGNGHSISGSNMSELFNIDGVNVTFRNINLVDACSIKSAAVYVSNGFLTLENSTMNNIAAAEASDIGETFTIDQIAEMAIYLENYYLYYGNLPVNVAYDGKYYGIGQVSYLMAQAILNIHNGNTDSVDTRSLGEPTSTGTYSGSFDSTLTFTEGQYTTENSDSTSNPRTGFTVRFVNFINTNNRVAANVGYTSNGKTSNIYFTSFVESSARILSYYKNSGHLPETTNYIGNIIIDRSSSDEGIAVQTVGSDAVYKNSSFTNIKGLEINGVLHSSSGKTLIEDCHFENNSAKSAGGIYVVLGTLNIENSTFINNIADGEGFGGVLNSQLSNVTIKGSEFYNNTAAGSYGQGGAALFNGGNVYIYDSIFANNKASAEYYDMKGGAILLQNSENVVIENSDFINNSANGFYTSSGGTIISAGAGGAISLAGQVSNFTLTGSKFESNYAGGFGGGGAISNSGNSNNYLIDSCLFNNNSALYGGAICFVGGTNTQLKNSNFTNNRAAIYGGALCGDYVISYSDFINNTAQTGGVISNSNTIMMYYSNFIGNNAVNGGILSGNMDVTAQYNRFINNSADKGAILHYPFKGVNRINFNYNIFVNNKASENGTFSYADESLSNMYNLDFNYWGINQNPVDSNFNYNDLSNYDIASYINLTVVGTNSTYTTLPTDFTVKFVGENAEMLPDLETTVAAVPEIGNLTPQSIAVSSNDSTVNLYPLEAGNTTLIVGLEYNTLAKLDLEVIQLIRKNYTFVIAADNITYGDNVVIEFTLLDADGVGLNETITFVLNNNTYEIELSNGSAVRQISLCPAGSYAISSEFITSDFFYNNASANASFEVTKAQSPIEIVVDKTVFGENANITANISNLANGNITFIVGGFNQTATVINGHASVSVPGLNSGNHTVDVYYSGDENFETSHANSSFHVDKVDTELTLNIVESVYGNNIIGNLTLATVNGDRLSGTVTITLNGKAYEIAAENGQANFTIDAQNAGKYELTGVYGGADNYNSAKASITVNVSKADADMEFELKESYLAGEDTVIFAVLPADATGEVIFTVNGTDHKVAVENGKATVVLTGLAYGNYNLTAGYSGDSNYNPQKIETLLNIRNLESAIDLTAQGIVYGQNLTVTADVTAGATGTVIFTVNNITIESDIAKGKATATFAGLDAGNYKITAQYGGDAVYAGSYAEAYATVSKAPTGLEIDVGEIVDGQPVTITATVTPAATGEITFSITGLYSERNRTITNGVATWLISPLERGAYTIVAHYNGDNNYLASHATYVVSVNQIDTVLDVSIANAEYGEDIIINVKLTAADKSLITAWVYVTVDDALYRVAVYNGTGSLNIGKLNADSYNFNATYNGNNEMKMSSDEGSFTVSKAQNVISAEAGSDKYITGDTVVINIKAPSDATGQVTVAIGNDRTVLDLKDGNAVYTFKASTPGIFNAQITYSGDGNYDPDSLKVSFTVSDIKIDASDVEMYYRNGTRLVATITENGVPAANKQVNITINGVTYPRSTDNNGEVSLAINLNSGTYDALISCGSVEKTVRVTVLSTVSGNDITKIFKNGTQYYATFVDSRGNPLANATVTFNINGVMYHRQTNENGVARLNINLNPGKYILTAMNPVNGEQHSNVVTVLPNIVENKDIVMYYKNGTRYTVKVLDSQGNPSANAQVSFNINGVIYYRTADSNGIVGLNINLNPGEYIITAYHNGLYVSNRIHVLPVLTGEDLTKTFGGPDAYESKLVDGHGNPLAGETITFNINGVFYNRTTDSDGIARLNINLIPGKYIVTAYYQTAAVSNTVTVLNN